MTSQTKQPIRPKSFRIIASDMDKAAADRVAVRDNGPHWKNVSVVSQDRKRGLWMVVGQWSRD